MTIKEALRYRPNQRIKPKEIEILLSFVLKQTREFLFAYPQKRLTKKQINKWRSLIEKRKKGHPLAYLIGQQEFYGLNFYVDSRVLIPRPETELLVENVLEKIFKDCPSKITIADIGTGSGNIIITLALKFKACGLKFKAYATDISSKALEVAQMNAKIHQVDNKITFLKGDLVSPLPEKIDYLLANLPYVAKNEMSHLPKEVKDFEPKIAFDGGRDGLFLYHQLLKKVDDYLNPSASLFLEIADQQKEKITRLIKKYLPLAQIKIIKDYAGHNRLIIIKNIQNAQV